MASEMEVRRQQIENLVNREGSVTFAQIKVEFGDMSEMTLRTDLKALDAEHRIVRVYGGARSVSHVVGTDGLIDERSLRNVDAKRIIAEKAAALVRPDMTVYFDSGSTTTELASALPDMHSLLITNSITCATALCRLASAQVIVPGGVVNRYSMSLSGSRAIEALATLSFDVAFVGITSYQQDVGFTCGVDDEATLKRLVMQRAGRTVALMDSSKVGHRSTFRVCGLESIDTIVSDGRLPADFLSACAEADVTVL